MRRTLLTLFITVSVFALAACKTSEERAEEHFQNAIQLLDSGDFERASVEFRNVFELNGRHREARSTYAATLRERGDLAQSFSQYLRLVEQYNGDRDGRLALAEMALVSGNRDEAKRHVTAGLSAHPDDLHLQAIKAAYDYSEGQITKDSDLTQAALLVARELQETLPENIVLRRVIVDDAIRNGRPSEALAAVDAAIEAAPNDVGFYRQRLALLHQMGEEEQVASQLRDMVDLFPEDPSMRRSLIQWYISREEFDEAEEFLRQLIARAPDTDTPHLDMITFLARYRSPERALEAIDEMIAADPGNPTLRATRGSLNFQIGNQETAVSDLQDLVENTEPSARLNDIKIILAKMLVQTANPVGARALVEEVLEMDASHVGALKLRANWLIDQDQTDVAIIALRAALDQSPRDPEVMTLMARAHERAGSGDLAAEMLALAVDASNKAPEESVRYAQFLLARQQLRPAENLLIDALKLSPSHPVVLFELGKVYVRTREWDRARQIVASLRKVENNPSSAQAANGLETAIVAGESGLDESIDFLNSMVDEGVGGVAAQAAIVRAHIQNGNLDAARSYIDEAVAKSSGDPLLRFIQASVQGLQGEQDIAEGSFRALTAENPDFALAWRALYVQLARENRVDEAEQVLDAALSAIPKDRDLRWAKAGILERDGKPEEALKVFEELYEEDSSSLIIANNLSSLIAEVSSDPDELARALRIARRLRGSSFGPFQDTYGWVAYKNKDYNTALEYLEPAAAKMQTSEIVQYHLAKVYLQLDREEDALAQFQRAVELVDADDTRPQIVESRAEIERLSQ